MCLERAIADIRTTESYKIDNQSGIGDWAPLIEALLSDQRAGLDVARIAAKFHNALANWILAVAQTADERTVVSEWRRFPERLSDRAGDCAARRA